MAAESLATLMPNNLLRADQIIREMGAILDDTVKFAQLMDRDYGDAWKEANEKSLPYIEYDASKGPPPERVVDPKTGISMRFIRDYDVQADQFPTRIYQPTGRNRRKPAVRPLVLDAPRAYFND